jgi:hypothetical protein
VFVYFRAAFIRRRMGDDRGGKAYKQRLADQKMADIQLGDFRGGCYCAAIVIGQAVSGMNVKATDCRPVGLLIAVSLYA